MMEQYQIEAYEWCLNELVAKGEKAEDDGNFKLASKCNELFCKYSREVEAKGMRVIWAGTRPVVAHGLPMYRRTVDPHGNETREHVADYIGGRDRASVRHAVHMAAAGFMPNLDGNHEAIELLSQSELVSGFMFDANAVEFLIAEYND